MRARCLTTAFLADGELRQGHPSCAETGPSWGDGRTFTSPLRARSARAASREGVAKFRLAAPLGEEIHAQRPHPALRVDPPPQGRVAPHLFESGVGRRAVGLDRHLAFPVHVVLACRAPPCPSRRPSRADPAAAPGSRPWADRGPSRTRRPAGVSSVVGASAAGAEDVARAVRQPVFEECGSCCAAAQKCTFTAVASGPIGLCGAIET